jgi:hypothetical protein
MKKITQLFSLQLLCVISAFSQNSDHPISLRNGNFIAAKNITTGNFKPSSLEMSREGGKFYLLVQFESIPNNQKQQAVKSAGLNLEQYVHKNAWFASADTGTDFQSLKSMGLISVNPVPLSYKIDAGLIDGSKNTPSKSKMILVTYYKTIDRAVVVNRLQQTGITVLPNKFEMPGSLFISCSADKLVQLASIPYIIYLSPQSTTDKPLNYNNKATHGNGALNYSGTGGRNLNGQGMIVGVGDDADVSSHVDFTGRLINRTPSYATSHGLHTTGTTGGGGIADAKHRGMAPRATLVSAYYSDIIRNATFFHADYNMSITNNSYHASEDGCVGEGAYDLLSNYVDQQSRAFDNLLHVVASGNDGALTCSPYPASYGTVKTGWQSAKNVLTVGSTDNTTNTISSFSSRGPVDDGRIKPEIVAGGTAIISTVTNSGYATNNGTSMATPTVTGSLALISQRYKQLNSNQLPKSALLKAIICNSADDMGTAGPDFIYGFGRLNSRKAVEAVEGNKYFLSSVVASGSSSHVISVPAGALQLKVMLVWTDKEAGVNAGVTLVNDLDLTVTTPSASTQLPLVLNANSASVTNAAAPGVDRLNNIEQVVISSPSAGNYTINVNGHAVPHGPQDYAIAYEVIMPTVVLEYPFGGETMVNSETEYIRWTAYDNSSNTFTLQYSTNNGSTWTTISSSVASTARNYAWTVPSGIGSSQCLVRISRNSTAYTDVSDYAFTIVGRPTVTASTICEGATELTWTAITGATGYEILMLSSDTMKVIGSTTSASYIVSGLSTTTDSWLAVRAVVSGTPGRASLGAKVLPTSGACSNSAFNDNLAATAITAPVTARIGTSTAANATQPIKVTIKNLDNQNSNSSFNVSYQINGGAVVTETISPTIGSLATYTHTFAQHSTSAGAATYDIKVWVTKTGDLHRANDTARKVVKLLANSVVTLPHIENFDAAPVGTYSSGTVGFDGLDAFDFNSTTTRGRARTSVNSGIPYSGTRALTLDQTYSSSSNTNEALMTVNLSNYNLSSDQLRIDFMYRNHGQPNLTNNKVWIRGSETGAWVQAYDLYSNQAAIGQYKAARGININDLLSSAVPAQTITSTFQIKFGAQGYTTANSPAAVVDGDDGYTFDDIKLTEAENDVAVTEIISPSASGCGLSSSHSITIKVKNFNNVALNNVPVKYRVNGGTIVSENINLNALETRTYSFATTADLSSYIDYEVDVWVDYALDTYRSNDSLNDFTVRSSPVISSFPYLEGFESDNGNWYTKGTNSSWEWGTPQNTIISKAANGTKAWVTNLTGKYNDYETSYLYSPCFNLSGMTQPVLSFSHIFKLEDNCTCDFHWAEYSTDGGLTWTKLGASGSGTNWYNNATQQKWQTSKTTWHVASYDVPTTSSSVRFRFVMSSDGGIGVEGVGIDDIHIFEKANIYSGATVTGISQSVSGSGWVNINSSGNRVVSINPNGQDLGTTTVSLYQNSGTIFNNFNQYHLARNLVIRPATAPAAPVSVRIYFTDAEAAALMAATGCAGCTAVADPYTLGLLKYSGTAGNENGSLTDNSAGSYSIMSANDVTIVPFNTGYYAEFNVSNFSEFWINNGTPSFTPGLWTGATSTVFSVASNWSDQTVPNSYSNITIPTGVSRMPVLSSAENVNNVSLQTGTSFSLNGHALTVNGTVSTAGTGKFIGSSTSTLNLMGGGSSTISFDQTTDGATNALATLIVNKSGAVNTLTNNLNIYSLLNIAAGNLNLNGNTLVMKSISIAGTAMVAPMGGTISYGSGGKIKADRFIPLGKRSYRFLAPGVSTTENSVPTSNIFSNWQNGGVFASGVGTHITGNGSNGTDLTQSGHSSLYTLTPGSTTYTPITSTNQVNDTLSALKGYVLFIRGDRTASNLTASNSNMNAATTLSASGQMINGTVVYNSNHTSVSGTDGGNWQLNNAPITNNTGAENSFSLIANPYLSMVDWNGVAKNSLSQTYYAWDPNKNISGGYETFNGSSNTASSTMISRYIQPGQAFFVQTTGANPSLTIAESHKNTTAGNLLDAFRSSSAYPSFELQLHYKSRPAEIADKAILLMDNSFSDSIGSEDSYKMSNPDDNICLVHGNSRLVFEGIKPITGQKATPVRLWKLKRDTSYLLMIHPNNVSLPAGMSAYLEDAFNNTSMLVNLNGVTTKEFIPTSDSASFYNRFRLVFRPASVLPVTFTSIKAYKQNAGVKVEWNVATERDVTRYEIERSADGRNFNMITSVSARSNNGSAVEYNAFDAQPLHGANFYRIKSVDNSGAIKYSSAVRVNISKSDEIFSIYPNRIRGNVVALQMNDVAKGEYELRLYSNAGQLVMSRTVQHLGGSSSQSVVLPEMAAGIYALQLLAENLNVRTTVIVE